MTTESLWVQADLLIDGTGHPPIVGGAVLVENSRVVAVGPQAAVPKPEMATAITFPGLTLLPGLIDCHTHLNFRGDGASLEEMMEDSDALLMLIGAQNATRALYAGVTTLCDNGGRGHTVFALKEGIRRGYIQGPRLLISGRPLTIPKGHCWPLGGEVQGEEALRQAVRQLVDEGADWIKVMASGGGTKGTVSHRPAYSANELHAIAGEAHAAGRWVGAHCNSIPALYNLLDAGYDMIIHGNLNTLDGQYRFDPELAARIADSGTWFNPTLHVCRGRIRRLERIRTQRPLTDGEANMLEGQVRYWAQLVDTFQRLLALNVRFVAGSDAGWSYFAFGDFAEEVDAMVEAGMAPGDALLAATRQCAEAIGIGREVGTLEPGKQADMLVVEGNPLEQVRSLLNVRAVFLGGVQVPLPHSYANRVLTSFA
jgi:imidazolonepropionase-like amidohydrolase